MDMSCSVWEYYSFRPNGTGVCVCVWALNWREIVKIRCFEGSVSKYHLTALKFAALSIITIERGESLFHAHTQTPQAKRPYTYVHLLPVNLTQVVSYY